MSDTPVCDAMFRAYHVLGDKPEAYRVRALETALRALYEDNMDYIRINKLSGAENNQVLRNARAALE